MYDELVAALSRQHQVAPVPCLRKRRLRWEISASGSEGECSGAPLLLKEACVTGLDQQVGRGRILGFSCSVLAQIRDTCLQTITSKKRRGKTNTLGWTEGACLCVNTCKYLQADQCCSLIKPRLYHSFALHKRFL